MEGKGGKLAGDRRWKEGYGMEGPRGLKGRGWMEGGREGRDGRGKVAGGNSKRKERREEGRPVINNEGEKMKERKRIKGREGKIKEVGNK